MLAYVGPGAGLVISASLLTVIVVAVSLLAAPLLAPVMTMWRWMRPRRFSNRHGIRKAVVVGLDGLDPVLLEELMAVGRLPNFARLAREGQFSRLETVAPPITPAAWSSFATGNDPTFHGIFDFITRDPTTYLPRLSSCQIDEPRALRLGPFRIATGRPRVRLLRRGLPFWKTLSEHDVQVTVLRVPITFPPEPFAGRLLSGMCVPDLLGSQGQYTHYSTGAVGGDEHHRPLEFVGDRARVSLSGPRHPSHAGKTLSAPMTLTRRGGRGLELRVSGRRITLLPGQYSQWVPVRFGRGFSCVSGLVQFYLKDVPDGVSLYASAVQLDPEAPATPISHPRIFSNYLAKRHGSFGTLGLLEDTSALVDGVLDDAGFLAQAMSAFRERKAMLMGALKGGQDDVTICVFDTPDRVQHMFWRHREPGHPARTMAGEADSGAPADAIEQVMVAADGMVGEVLDQISDDTLLLIISDHGFASFQRQVDLNAWLAARGYLHLLPGAAPGAWLEGIDWSRTRAFALGLVGIYINRKGREAQGIVEPGAEEHELALELQRGLSEFLDEARGGQRVVRRVFIVNEDFDGPYRNEGPDLLVGYEKGYRCSWECARGSVGQEIILDNTRKWSGDHCIDPEAVPGVLISNRRLPNSSPRLIDIGATVLDVYGVNSDVPMQGRSLLRPSEPVKGAIAPPVRECAGV